MASLTQMENRAVMAESMLEATLQYQSSQQKAQLPSPSPRYHWPTVMVFSRIVPDCNSRCQGNNMNYWIIGIPTSLFLETGNMVLPPGKKKCSCIQGKQREKCWFFLNGTVHVIWQVNFPCKYSTHLLLWFSSTTSIRFYLSSASSFLN
jgi:hypothetical protein